MTSYTKVLVFKRLLGRLNQILIDYFGLPQQASNLQHVSRKSRGEKSVHLTE